MCLVTPIVRSGKSIVSDSCLGKRDNIHTIWENGISFEKCWSASSYKMIQILPGNRAKVANALNFVFVYDIEFMGSLLPWSKMQMNETAPWI